MSARWLRILEHKQEFGFETGPTIPFLLGAMRQPVGKSSSPDVGRSELGYLVAEICAHASLQWCHGIMEFAVVARGPQAHFSVNDPTNVLKGVDTNDASAMTKALWVRHEDPISTARFSLDRDSLEWRSYLPNEVDRIGNALAASD